MVRGAPDRSVSKRFLTETHAFNSQGNHCYRAFFAEYPRSEPFKQCVAQEHVYLGSNGLLSAEVELMRGAEWEYDYASDERQTNLRVPRAEDVAFEETFLFLKDTKPVV
jgi:hypothetical protein